MRKRVRRVWALCCVGAGLGLGLVTQGVAEDAPPQQEKTEKLITMDFQDVDLAVLVKFISDLTGRNFIVDERVKGKITVISPAKISIDEAYAVFQSVLQVKGFTTVPSGVVTKILPTKDAKTTTLKTVAPGAIPVPTDEFVTRLVPLTKVDANAILNIVQPLVSPDGLLSAYAPTNTIIVIDSASNTERLVRLLHRLDVEGQERAIEVLRLAHAFAEEIAAKLAEVLEEPEAGGLPVPAAGAAPKTTTRATKGGAAGGSVAGGSAGRTFKIIPDERTNSLIVIAGPIEMRRIKELVARLDVPLPLGTGRIHVYYLKHANAEELVSVLADLIGGGGGGGGGIGRLGGRLSGGLGGMGGVGGLRGSRTGSSRLGRGTRSSAGGGLGSLGDIDDEFGGGFASGRIGRGRTGVTGVGGPTTAAGGAAGAGGGQEFEGEVRITADPATNSLIINASPQDFETIKDVIEKLDVRRRQVYVEAIILEVDLDRSRSLGFSFQGGSGLGEGVGLGRFNFTQSALGPAVSQFGVPGLILAAASSQTIRLPDGTTMPAQAALLNALQTDSDFNILSAPNILTTDNQEAEIVSGRNLPFLASRSTSETNLANTFATIERRDVGITLRITPQISEGGTIRLDIFQEVSDTTEVAGLDPNALGPATTIRSATTTVVARDGQTVVIGGLISDTIRNTQSKVPYIGDIPLFGNLLNNRNSSRSKINLLLFLTPHIVRNENDQAKFSKIERGKMQAFMDEERILNRRREVLERPSWDVESLPPLPKQGERGDQENSTAPPGTGLRGDAPAALGNGAAARTGEPERVGAALEESRPYVLLASVWEKGDPPPSLAGANGLTAIVLPDDSDLVRFFRPGKQYRFEGGTFSAVYECLDSFPSAASAHAMYPEGMRLSSEPRAVLHWQEVQDASARNVVGWSQVN